MRRSDQVEFATWLNERQVALLRAAKVICFDTQNAEADPRCATSNGIANSVTNSDPNSHRIGHPRAISDSNCGRISVGNSNPFCDRHTEIKESDDNLREGEIDEEGFSGKSKVSRWL